jgi:hypothetical protein
VHILVVDDQDHPRMTEIHAELIELWSRGVYLGMCLGRKIWLNHVEDKAFQLDHHSEKLAIAFGGHQLATWYYCNPHFQEYADIAATLPTKFIAKIAGRTIIVLRDKENMRHI